MKSIIFALAFAVATPPFALNQQDGSGKITGVWKSLNLENGEPLAEVTIKKVNGKLTGAVTLRGLTQAGKENVTLEFPITDLAFDGKTLSLKLTLPEPEKAVTVWEFLLRGNEEARFAIIKENDTAVEDGPVFVMKQAKAN